MLGFPSTFPALKQRAPLLSCGCAFFWCGHYDVSHIIRVCQMKLQAFKHRSFSRFTNSSVSVTWAQRSSSTDPARNYLYVNLRTADVAKSTSDLKITPTNVTFTGPSKKGVTYHVSLDLYDEIDPENSKVNHNDREVELVLRKKEAKDEFWPRLLKTDKKVHFLKTDFDKVRLVSPRTVAVQTC